MNDFKGSKGDWYACCSGDGSKSHFVFANEEATVCAMMSNDPDDKESEFGSMEGVVTVNERQANARLIAAAPTMLKALQMVDKALEAKNINGQNSLFHRQVRNAIKKALNQ